MRLLQPLFATIDVLVRPCVAGEYATFSNTTSAPGLFNSSSVSCRTCAAPTFSFSAYPQADDAAAASEKDVCQICPERGICVAGEALWCNRSNARALKSANNVTLLRCSATLAVHALQSSLHLLSSRLMLPQAVLKALPCSVTAIP